MTFASILRLLLRYWLLIVLATLVAGAGVFVLSKTRDPLYTATAKEFFAVSRSGSAAEAAQGSNYVQDQMASFGQLATSPAVLNPVIDDLGLTLTVKQLARSIEVATPRSTVVMQIDVTNPDPRTAAAIANAVGNQLVVAVDSVGATLPNGKPLVVVQSIQSALPPTVQSSPNSRRDAALGALIGLLLAVGAVLARARLDNRVGTPAVLADVTEKPLLGAVRTAGNLRSGGLVVVNDPQSPSAEDLRHLRSNVTQLALGRPSYVLAVTSSIREEGRSVIAANLAAALGEAGHSVILVDADFRAPRAAAITGAREGYGLLDAVQRPGALTESIQEVPQAHFDVLTAGGTHANPAELLGSASLASVLGELRQHYGFVVIDTPALLAVADAKALNHEVDGALMVADAKSLRRPQLTTALETAERAGLPVVGVVLNEVAERDLAATTGYAASEPRRSRSEAGRDARSTPAATAVGWDTPAGT